jgi:hypothetical protein
MIASGAYAVIISKMQSPPEHPTALQQLFTLTPEKAMQEWGLFIVMGPLFATVSSLICAGIAHLFLMLAGGANKSYHVTLRVFCFSYGSTQLLQLLPFCGSLVAPVWLLICCATGLSVAHTTTMGRSMAAMGFFLVACCVCCFAFFFIAIGMNYDALRPLLKQ